MDALRLYDPSLQTWPTTRRDRSHKPVFALSGRTRDDGRRELFFVNHSPETLTRVVNASAALLKTDEAIVGTSTMHLSYADVQPGEAVKIDEFDDFYDLDELIIDHVTLDSPSQGRIGFTVAAKGGCNSMVLLWEDGFISPHCSMCRVGNTPDHA